MYLAGLRDVESGCGHAK